MRAFSSRPFCSCDSRRVSLWDLSAGLRYTAHASHNQTATRQPDHHHRFSGRSDLLTAPGRSEGVSRMCAGLHPVHRLSARTQGHVSRRWVPDPPLPLCPRSSGWSHHLAAPVHHVSRGVHGPAPLRLALSRDAPGGGAQGPLGDAWGLSLARCAVIGHISPMALYRLICALGHQSLVAVLTRCGLPLPASILADEKHSRCLTERVYLPTIVRGRVIWHLGHSASKSAAAFTESSGVFQRAALAHEPSYQVRGALTDGFDSTVSSLGPSRDKGLTRVASLATMRPQHAGPVAAGDARPPDAPDRAALSLPPRTAPMAYHGGTRPSSAALSDWRPSLLALDGARQRSTAQAKTVRRLAAECPRPSHSTASSRLVGMGAGRHGWQRHVAVSGRARRRRAVQYMVGARE